MRGQSWTKVPYLFVTEELINAMLMLFIEYLWCFMLNTTTTCARWWEEKSGQGSPVLIVLYHQHRWFPSRPRNARTNTRSCIASRTGNFPIGSIRGRAGATGRFAGAGCTCSSYDLATTSVRGVPNGAPGQVLQNVVVDGQIVRDDICLWGINFNSDFD